VKVKNYKQIIDDINNKVYHPIYFLYGEEPYYIDLVSDFIENNILSPEEKEFNQTVLYGKDSNVFDIITTLKRFPMMANYQVVVIREAQYLDKIEELESYFNNPVKTTILVVCHKYKKIDGRSKFFKTIDKSSVSFESTKLYENQIADWVCAYLRGKKINIEPTACALLTEYMGNNLSHIANELDKLILNIKEGENVSTKLIEQHIGISKEFSVFELQKALAFRNNYKIFRIVHYFASNIKDNPIPKIAPMLVDYFAKVMATRYMLKNKMPAGDIPAAIGVKPFFVEDYKKAAVNYSELQLRSIFAILREYDLKSKGVGNSDLHANDGELMKEMVFKILHV